MQTAQAQAAFLIGRLVGIGVGAAVNASRTPKSAPVAAQPVAEVAAAPQALVMQRTPADKLPKRASEQIVALEAQLEQCHAAMLASPTAVVCTAEQRTAIQQAAISVARAKPDWSLQPYQQEMAFYQAEDARRQPAPTPPAPAK
ncbi:MAG: hypothetical protein ACRYG7_04790 [Janthinobacterium lividum]